MTPERARAILSSQSMHGFGAEIDITDAERQELWDFVSAAPVSMSIRDMVCRIARGDAPDKFPAWMEPTRADSVALGDLGPR